MTEAKADGTAGGSALNVLASGDAPRSTVQQRAPVVARRTAEQTAPISRGSGGGVRGSAGGTAEQAAPIVGRRTARRTAQNVPVSGDAPRWSALATARENAPEGDDAPRWSA